MRAEEHGLGVLILVLIEMIKLMAVPAWDRSACTPTGWVVVVALTRQAQPLRLCTAPPAGRVKCSPTLGFEREWGSGGRGFKSRRPD